MDIVKKMIQNKNEYKDSILINCNQKKDHTNSKSASSKELIKRLITASGLILFVILFLFFGASSINLFGFNSFKMHVQLGFGCAYLFLGILVFTIALWELFKVHYKHKNLNWWFILYFLVGINLAFGPTFLYYFNYMHFYHLTMNQLGNDWGWIELAGFFLGGLILFIMHIINIKYEPLKICIAQYVTFILIVYFFMFFNMIMLLHTWTSIFIIWVPVIFADSFAYLGGRRFGKHKLAPNISPKKTWEGLGFGVSSAVVIMLIIAGTYQADQSIEVNNYGYPILNNNINGNLFGITYTNSTSYHLIWVYFLVIFILGIVIALLSVFGDLLFSYFKRLSQIKDYGKLLPGHGGILDRIDSLIVVTIFMGLYQVFSFVTLKNQAPILPFIS